MEEPQQQPANTKQLLQKAKNLIFSILRKIYNFILFILRKTYNFICHVFETLFFLEVTAILLYFTMDDQTMAAAVTEGIKHLAPFLENQWEKGNYELVFIVLLLCLALYSIYEIFALLRKWLPEIFRSPVNLLRATLLFPLDFLQRFVEIINQFVEIINQFEQNTRIFTKILDLLQTLLTSQWGFANMVLFAGLCMGYWYLNPHQDLKNM